MKSDNLQYAREHAPVSVAAPASKSLSHRYLIGAALARGESALSNCLESQDLEATRDILCAAGAQVKQTRFCPQTQTMDLAVRGMAAGPQGGSRDAPLDCQVRESGTSCRLLLAVLAAGRGFFHIHGSGRMHERPVGELACALMRLGAGITYQGNPGCPPLLLDAHGLDPSACSGVLPVSMDDSSQYFSGLLMAAPLATESLTLLLAGSKAVSWPYVGLTLQCLTDFGIDFLVESRKSRHSAWQAEDCGSWRALREARPHCLRVTVRPGAYRPGLYSVEGDWSGASYFLAAGALGPRPVRVEGLRPDSLQGDRAMLRILEKMGALLDIEQEAVTVYPSPLHGVSLDMGSCPDLVPTVAVLASFATGSTRIGNVSHLRIKESDRISAPAAELAKVGIVVDELSEGLLVNGLGARQPRLPEGDLGFSAHNDHRMAMSLALLERRLPELDMRARLDNPDVVAKSFPHFWKLWDALC